MDWVISHYGHDLKKLYMLSFNTIIKFTNADLQTINVYVTRISWGILAIAVSHLSISVSLILGRSEGTCKISFHKTLLWKDRFFLQGIQYEFLEFHICKTSNGSKPGWFKFQISECDGEVLMDDQVSCLRILCAFITHFICGYCFL